jgi:hypothetical protein
MFPNAGRTFPGVERIFSRAHTIVEIPEAMFPTALKMFSTPEGRFCVSRTMFC